MSKLAIFGGAPARKRPFFSSVVIDNKERALVNKVLRAKEFSRFMGSPSRDIEKLLAATSKDAARYDGQYFNFLGGRMVREFERRFAEKFGVKYAVSVNSATSGLSAALGAIGAGPGDEIITTCLSFNATAASILVFNSIPVFVDVDKSNFCIDPRKVEEAVTPKTKAILVVHLLGNPADMDKIMAIAKRHDLKVIEDCAQAPGTKYKGRYVGTIGDMGVFSFQETKNIMTGEGGMMITDNPELAKRARLIRNHGESIPDEGWDRSDLVNMIGMNFRMTELTAAMGVAQMGKLDENNRTRTRNARFLADELKGLPGLSIPSLKKGVIPHIFAMVYDESLTGTGRDKVLSALRAEGIPVGSGYLRTMYENPIFTKKTAYGKDGCPWSCRFYGSKRAYKQGDCPIAEDFLRKKFIWFYHINRPNTISDMKDVLRAFKKVFTNLELLKKNKMDTEIKYKW